MQRGLKIFLCGFVPLFIFIVFGGMSERGSVGASANFQVGFVSATLLFMFGTIRIVTDKGHHWLTGVLLTPIAPLGTIIALILPDLRNPPAVGDVLAHNVDLASSSFQRRRTGVINAVAAVAIVYGLFAFLYLASFLLSFKGGMPGFKILLSALQGLAAGLSLWGAVVMLSIAIAPRKWLLESTDGRFWMERSGFKTASSTVPLRILTAIIGLAAASWLAVQVLGLLSAMFAHGK